MEGKKARGQAYLGSVIAHLLRDLKLIKERSRIKSAMTNCLNIQFLSWERMSEGQERVNTNFSLLPTPGPSLIREGSNIVSLFPLHSSLKQKTAFTLAEGSTHVALLNNQRKIAFTLAEVLITLGIIGIVAAMTMPSLIQNYQKKQTVSQLQKAYSTFSQALVQSQQENGQSSEWSVTVAGSSYEDNLAYFNTYWKPYLKVIKVCKTMKECGYNITGFASLTDRHNYTYYGLFNNVPGFIYGDGTYASIRPYGFNNVALQLLVIDINGSKMPNIIGRDVFHFQIDTTRGVISGYSSTKENLKLCTKEEIGNGGGAERSRLCAGKIMADGWQILDDYPW